MMNKKQKNLSKNIQVAFLWHLLCLYLNKLMEIKNNNFSQHSMEE